MTSTEVSFVKKFLAKVDSLVAPYVTDAYGQAVAWFVIVTHHLTSVEAGATAVGTLALTRVLKAVKKWLG